MKSTWQICVNVSTLCSHTTLGQRSSNGHNFAIIYPIVTYLWRDLQTSLYITLLLSIWWCVERINVSQCDWALYITLLLSIWWCVVRINVSMSHSATELAGTAAVCDIHVMRKYERTNCEMLALISAKLARSPAVVMPTCSKEYLITALQREQHAVRR